MSFNISTLGYNVDTGSVLKYLEMDDRVQTAGPTMKRLGSAAVIFGLALSASTMEVPSYVRLSGVQRPASERTNDFRLGGVFKNNSANTYAEQMDEPLLPGSVLASLKAAGVNTSIAASIIKVAQFGLLDMGYPVLKIEAKNLNDPEEDAIYVTINLIVAASFEKTLELDSDLARALVKNFANIPSAFSIAVKEAT